MGALGKIFHVNLLGYVHLFMSIRISHMKYQSVSVYQARYSTSIAAKYLDTATIKTSRDFIRPLCHMILSSPNMMHRPVMSKLRS